MSMRMSEVERLVIKGGTLIDGTGRAPVPNGVIVIEGNEITRVEGRGASTEGRAGETIIDATDKFIMPGMIDGHIHLSSHQGALPGVRFTSTPEFATLWAARSVGQVLRAGVTGISVPGGKWYVDVTVRDAIDGGVIEGPRVFCAGRALTPYGGIFDASEPPSDTSPDDAVGVLCNTMDDYIRETRRQCKRGVNLIKVADSYWGDTQTVAQEELAAVVNEAHRRNVRVAIHSRGSGSTRAAALAGVDWIFHADLATDEDLDAVAEVGAPIMPVFTQCQLIAEQGEDMGFSRAMRERVKVQLERSYRTIEDARARGIPILAGTDSGNAAAFAYGRYHGLEAEIFVKHLGFSAMDAIVAYTSLNARAIGLDGRVGIIAPGKLADIIIWDEDPLADITLLQRPSQLVAVIKDGRVIDRTVEGFRRLEREPMRARVTPQG
jgi:imidazolonepropionase-like amidohydrolase